MRCLDGHRHFGLSIHGVDFSAYLPVWSGVVIVLGLGLGLGL
jgi:hypothetical protein